MAVRMSGVQVALVLFALTATPRAAPAHAGSDPADPRPAASRLAHALMSPYCPGLTLAVCSSPGAAALRREIADRLDQGETVDAVRNNLVRRFGSRISGEPEFRGIGWLAWTLPVVAGVAGLCIAGVAVRRATTSTIPTVPAAEDHVMVARLTAELEALD